MGDDDKPFACSSPGCGMRFANEDHLLVHNMKHEMSLALTPSMGRHGAPGSFIVADQTPTPTKFLRYGEEIGLFSELKQNPFEEAFKKASESLADGKPAESHASETVPLPGPETGGTLHTPTPKFIQLQFDGANTPRKEMAGTTPQPEYIPLPGPAETIGSTVDRARFTSPNFKRTTFGITRPSNLALPTVRAKQTWKPGFSTPSGTGTKLATPTTHIPVRTTPSTPTGFNLPVKLKLKDGTLKTPDMEDTPVISRLPLRELEAAAAAAAQDSMSSQGSFGDSASIHTDSPEGPPPPASQDPSPLPVPVLPGTSVTASPSGKGQQYYLQVMVQMPSGETVPVQIPAALANQPAAAQATAISLATSGAAAVSKATSDTPTPVVVSSAPSLAKQKLKEVLSQNVSVGSNVLNSNMRIMSEAVERVSAPPVPPGPVPGPAPPMQTVVVKTIPVGQAATFAGGSLSNGGLHASLPKPVSSVSAMEYLDMEADYSPPSKRLKGLDDDPDDRRKKFLERNRAAAARCRTKKKAWIMNLERKADEMQQTNAKLQNEVSMLRNEVAQLKSLLLAHKDCPITIAQQNAGQINSKTLAETQSDSISSSTSQPAAAHKAAVGRGDALPSSQLAIAPGAAVVGPGVPAAAGSAALAQRGAMMGGAMAVATGAPMVTVGNASAGGEGLTPIIISVTTMDPRPRPQS